MKRFHADITAAVYRAAKRWRDITSATLEELVQDTYLRLCDPEKAILQRFVPRHPGSGAAFIRVIAAHLVSDHFKSVHTQKHGEGLIQPMTGEEQAAASPSCPGGIQTIEREVLLGQIDRYLQAIASGPTFERDRQIFWYYYRHGMSAQEIAQVPTIQLTAKGVESAIFRLTRLVRELMVKEHLSQRAKLSEARESGFQIAESL